MKAIAQDEYGAGEALGLREIDKPVPKDHEVMVRVVAASLHAGDYFLSAGIPYVMRLGIGLTRPRKVVPGLDVAGVVEQVGASVSEFEVGDEVFGESRGSCAEFAVAKASKLAPKPSNLTLAQSAALAVSGVTALIGIRDAGKVGPGMHVLINGASGGVGSYAVQIAKALGAEVTGICSTRNIDAVRSIGADHVVDYTVEDFTRTADRYALILDNVGNITLGKARQVLEPGGKLIPNSGRTEGRWVGPLAKVTKAAIGSLFVRQQGRPFVASVTKEKALELKALVEAGRVRPLISQTYRLAEVPEAMDAVAGGHVRGKVLIEV